MITTMTMRCLTSLFYRSTVALWLSIQICRREMTKLSILDCRAKPKWKVELYQSSTKITSSITQSLHKIFALA